eukprot:132558-Alexandrium_andersonii.AAC.1
MDCEDCAPRFLDAGVHGVSGKRWTGTEKALKELQEISSATPSPLSSSPTRPARHLGRKPGGS